MPLVVEDGTGKADAQSYVSEADAQTYAAARGLTLPADAGAVAQLLLRAMDYIEGFRDRFKGEKTNAGVQALQWPRTCVELDGADWPTNALPPDLIAAQCVMAVQLNAGFDPMVSGDGRAVSAEQIGSLRTEYAVRQSEPAQPRVPLVDRLLQPLLVNGGAGGLTVTRS